MSLSAVRSYFRDRLNGLGESLAEWPDGFNFSNIPESIQDRSYHIESGLITGAGQNQTALDATSSIVIRVFLLGYRDPASTIDEAISLGETILCDIINPVNANSVAVKDVNFDSMQALPLDGSNDNTVILEINFTARSFIKTV